MAHKHRTKAWLLHFARTLSEHLNRHRAGTGLRMRRPAAAGRTWTDGWRVRIGRLGQNGPHMEVWLDHFTGHKDRKLWLTFTTESGRALVRVSQRVSALTPVRTIKPKDAHDKAYYCLRKKMPANQFGRLILEEYPKNEIFLGMYDPLETSEQFVFSRAAAFFESVARVLPRAKAADDTREVYPQRENRKQVVSHVRRERSQLLAQQRKLKDNFTCQVCGLRMEDIYGKLGTNVAESHHRIALSKLRENVRTRIEDLVTVCPNCHRVLHRMDGEYDDVVTLRKVIRKHHR